IELSNRAAPIDLSDPGSGLPAARGRCATMSGVQTRTGPAARRGEASEERLKILYGRWDEFAQEYAVAREQNDQEVMTSLRGLMLLIKREIRRLGGELPPFPAEENHLADL